MQLSSGIQEMRAIMCRIDLSLLYHGLAPSYMTLTSVYNVNLLIKDEVKEMGAIKKPTMGCPACNGGKGVFVCKDHWKKYKHQKV